jgi:acetyltransferase
MVESPRTRVVLAIAERLSDGEKLRALAERAAALDKPIVMVKVGRSEAGSRAAASHTGSLTGSDAVCDAALNQLGIIRVDDCNELYETAMLLRRGHRPSGRRAAAVSISGGNLVMLADLGGRLGIEWPAYAEATQATLRARLPGFSTAANPTDLTAASIGSKDTFATVSRIIAEDPAVDVLIPVLTFSPAAEIRSVAEVSSGCDKPVALLWTGKASDDPTLTPASLVAEGHAVYRDALPCLKAVRAAIGYAAFRTRRGRAAVPRPAGIDAAAARRLVEAGSGPLGERQSKEILACYGLTLTREALAQDRDSAVSAAVEIGWPVALKVQSPDLPHKTEAGAIRLGLLDAEAVRRGYDQILAAALAYQPDARVEGVLVQEMVTEGQEMLVGVSRDPTFGPVLAVGLGGIYVEILKDVAFRLPPIGPQDALEMLHELRGYPLLAGVRGQAAGDLDALADCIARVSWLAVDLADLVGELDINPVRVLPQGRGVRVVDALVVRR